MLAIRGSGFGLYGYLPALVAGCGQRIVLPERYRTRFEARPELSPFAGAVRWERDDRIALDRAIGVAIAVPPSNQRELVPECLARSNIRYLLLEKPLAPSPEMAMTLLEHLVRSGKTFRVGYILRHTSWGKQLLDVLTRPQTDGRLTIRWTFMADHFERGSRTWKRFSESGGGAIRFYGIHLMALLAEAGYRDVITSDASGSISDECEKWTALFSGANLPECEVVVDTKSTARKFQIELTSPKSTMTFADLDDPFHADAVSDRTDRRVAALQQLWRSLFAHSGNEYDWYDASIQIWRTVERRTRFVLNG